MFDNFYGLTGKPFQLTPDPEFYFRSVTHRKALSYLGYGLAQGEGFIVITGEIGSGKSTMVAHLMKKVDPEQMTVGQVVTKGQTVGGVGSTGWSTGPHLHFELRVEAEPLNPEPFFAAP